tara:strand:- start:1005 stop:1871 length:867 start_codon:yes stop_codon:yes gene_type:complete
MAIRNNESRTGARPNTDPAPTQPQQQSTATSTPPLSFATPTEIVELPSRGKYYPTGHPLHGMGEVEIRYMTARDEDILNSRTLIKKGVVIDRLLANVLVDKKINLDDLLLGDKNALVVSTRITGYGEEYDTNANCPVCGLASKCSFRLDEATIKAGGSADLDGVEETEEGTFIFKLPKANVEVEVRLLNGHDEKKINQMAEKRKKYDLGETSFTDQLRMSIKAVNGTSDIAVISSLVENMPARDSRYFREVINKVTPNIDMMQPFSCENCGHEGDMEVPLTADFFWPR